MSRRRRRLSGSGAVGLIGERGVLTDLATFTRASSATLLTDPSTLAEVADNIPRFSYNSVYGGRKYLHEGARTNSIRNNTMQGAAVGVVGSGGALPTNWEIGGGTGLTTEVIEIGTVNGFEYIDIKISGTSGSTSYALRYEPLSQIVASSGQVWTNSNYVSLIAGATTNINSLNTRIEFQSGSGNTSSNFVGSINSTLTRYTVTATAGASTTHALPQLTLGYSSGVAVNITLRIALPQMELGSFASSPIKTTTTAVSRALDVNTIATSNLPVNFNDFSLFIDFQLVGADLATPRHIFNLNTSGTANIVLFKAGGGNNIDISLSGTQLGSAFLSPLDRVRFAARLRSGDNNAYFNGTQYGDSTFKNKTFSINPNSLQIGDSPAFNRQSFIHISEFLILPYGVSDTVLNQWSAAL